VVCDQSPLRIRDDHLTEGSRLPFSFTMLFRMQ
jgi:hypothetical protein